MEDDVDVDAYRAQLRAWLAEHLPDDLVGLRFDGDPGPERLARLRTWNAALADAGYAAPAWPVEHGGRGLGVLGQVAHAEEMAAARAPGPINAIGIPNIAPAIMAHGTEAQQRRHLRTMLRGEEIWCQGFSEPEAGSDLASLRCRADRDGDHYVVTGQKVWTTLGQVADWCELLVRTDPEAARPSRGITCLLVDVRLPGITVAPLRTVTGDADFNAVFLDEVRVPVSCRLGAEHAGWAVARATLANERGGVAALHLDLRTRIAELIAAARAAGRTADPLVRDRLGALHIEGERLRFLADRSLALAAAGHPPGPESSVVKLAWSMLGQHLAEVAVEVLGLDALDGEWGDDLLRSRSLSIAGGTTEVNKTIVGERVLGLPREPDGR
ncbi:MAG: acyl-CoA dehydrogenase family protein [Acidimicrobiales bacterium]